MRIADHAKGRWPEIIAALLGEDFVNSRRHHPCPGGGGIDRFRFSDIAKNGGYFCSCSQGEKDGFELLMCAKGWDFATAAKEVERVIGRCPKDGQETKPRPESWASKLRRETIKTKRSSYLESRGLEVPDVLDWHTSLPYYDESGKIASKYPAMLAPVMRGDEFVTYHVTYLDRGSKAPVKTNRKLMGSVGGIGSVPLYEPMHGCLGIAEGIETAIAAKILSGMPVWAALNTSLMVKWMPPEGVNSIVIFGDCDRNCAGQAAAYALAHKLIGKGYEVSLQFPPMGEDFNDVLLGQREAS